MTRSQTKVGKWQIREVTHIIMRADEKTEIDLVVENARLNVGITFKEEETEKAGITWKQKDGRVWITFEGFSTGLGRATNDVVELGTVDNTGEKIGFRGFVYPVGEVRKLELVWVTGPGEGK